MSFSPDRRRWLAGTSSAAALLIARRAGGAEAGKSTPGIEVVSRQVISQLPHRYHGWPTLARRKNGQLLVVCSGGRDSHVCPFGRVELMRSNDEGERWTWPQTLIDTAIDDRDAGALETAAGTLLVTTFTSLAYEPILAKGAAAVGTDGAWDAEKLARWQGANDRVPAETRHSMLGTWMIRSTDGGASWSQPYRVPVNSPHGPTQLGDGRLLYSGKALWTNEQRVGVCESRDDGLTWQWLADIPPREGDTTVNYHELHAVEAADGRLVVHIRNHNTNQHFETLQCVSTDAGKTWSKPASIGVWGMPSHLLRLKDDRLLMSYGHRRAPYGNQARVSADHGQTWSEPLRISEDGAGGDLGYPSTVQRNDGSLLTVWYEKTRENAPRAVLRSAHWKLTG